MDNEEEFIRQAFLTYEQKTKEDRERRFKDLGAEYSQVELNQLITQTKRDTGFGEADAIDYILDCDDNDRAKILEAYKDYKKFLKVNESLFETDREEKPLARVKDKKERKIELKDSDRVTHHINEHSLVDPSYDTSSSAKSNVQEGIVNLNNDDEVSAAAKKQNEESDKQITIITDLIGVLGEDGSGYENESQVDGNKSILQCAECGHKYCIDPTKLAQSEDDENIYNIDIPCPFCHQSCGYILLRGQIEPQHTEETSNENPADKESEKEPKEEDEFSVEDIEYIDEESFNREVNKYLNTVYENISSFSCVRVNTDEKYKHRIIIDGLLCFKGNKKPVLTEFYLIGKKQNNKIEFAMRNKSFSEAINPFRISGSIKNKNLTFENLHYNYSVNSDGEKVQIRG